MSGDPVVRLAAALVALAAMLWIADRGPLPALVRRIIVMTPPRAPSTGARSVLYLTDSVVGPYGPKLGLETCPAGFTLVGWDDSQSERRTVCLQD